MTYSENLASLSKEHMTDDSYAAILDGWYVFGYWCSKYNNVYIPSFSSVEYHQAWIKGRNDGWGDQE
jgi:hypothetical protein